jgi:uncharacterized protein YqfB (UPF0267 family)
MVIAVFVRRLREGKTYEDFREAWLADKGFGVPTRVVNGQRLDDEREIISIGFVDIDPADLAAGADRVAEQEAVRHDRIAEVIEPGSTRVFYVQRDSDDLS